MLDQSDRGLHEPRSNHGPVGGLCVSISHESYGAELRRHREKLPRLAAAICLFNGSQPGVQDNTCTLTNQQTLKHVRSNAGAMVVSSSL